VTEEHGPADNHGRLAGRVAFITGAARGQGRSHAVAMAGEGADIIGVDSLEDIETVPYPGATQDDLNQTIEEVQAHGRRMIGLRADVRDLGALALALDKGVAELGRLDVVVANAGVFSFAGLAEMSEPQWLQMIDVNLNGVWRTCKAAVPHLIRTGGGSIAIISSTAGLHGVANIAHYAAAKHGLVGLMRSLSIELAPLGIRVNSIHPTNVDTAMIQNDAVYRLFLPDVEAPTRADFAQLCLNGRPIPVPWIEARDVANAALFLASDDARYITGVALPIDGGTAAQ
jgi:(+)-trans-carveol dehydrogenase